MADWSFGTSGVFVQPVREDFVTLTNGGAGGLLSNPAEALCHVGLGAAVYYFLSGL